LRSAFLRSRKVRIICRQRPDGPEIGGGRVSFVCYRSGQAISYQIGKIQILHFLADAPASARGPVPAAAFDDFLWTTGTSAGTAALGVSWERPMTFLLSSGVEMDTDADAGGKPKATAGDGGLEDAA